MKYLLVIAVLIYLILTICQINKDIIVKPQLNCICEQQLLTRDNNIPGILPGGIPGDTLGLEHKPELNLFTINPFFCKKNMTQFLCKKCDKYNGSYHQCTNNSLYVSNSDINRYLKQQF